MPIRKRAGETKDEYVSRCIAMEINSGKASEQAAAICYAHWDEKQLNAVKRIRNKNKNFLKDLDFEKTRVYVESSNADRVMWNSDNLQLTISFLDGSIYTYYDVSEEIFNKIIDGDWRPKTTDTQNPPRWVEGRKPSVGAAIHHYLIEKNVSYDKGGSFR